MATEEVEDEYDDEEVEDMVSSSTEDKEALKVQAAKENKMRPLFHIRWKRVSHLNAVLSFFASNSWSRHDTVFHIDQKNGITANTESTRIHVPPEAFDVYDIKKDGYLVFASDVHLSALDRNAPLSMRRDDATKAQVVLEQGDTILKERLDVYSKPAKFVPIDQMPVHVTCPRVRLVNAVHASAKSRQYGGDATTITVSKSGNVKCTGRDGNEEAVVDITRHCNVEFGTNVQSISNPYPARELADMLKKLRVPTVTLLFGTRKQSPIGIRTHVFEESISLVGVMQYGTAEMYLPAARSY